MKTQHQKPDPNPGQFPDPADDPVCEPRAFRVAQCHEEKGPASFSHPDARGHEKRDVV